MSTTPLNPILEMQIGGNWVDVTPDARLQNADSNGGIEVTRGVPNEGAAAEPTQLNITLNNGLSKALVTAGQTSVYSPNNPNGPWFGLLGRNQRLRYGVDRRIDDFSRARGSNSIVDPAIDGSFESGISGWSAPAGGTWTRAGTHPYTGSWSGQLTTTGAPASTSVRTPQMAVVVGQTYRAAAQIYSDTTKTNVQLTIDWYTAGSVFISSSTVSPTVTAGTHQRFDFTAVAPGTAAFATFGPTMVSSPVAGSTIWVDLIDMMMSTGSGWGYLPNQVHADGSLITGEQWRSYGSTTYSSLAAGEATITGVGGNKILTYRKTYGDVEVSSRVKVSARDTEFGLILRMKKYFLEVPIGIADPKFDTSVAGWFSSGGTVSLDNTIRHTGAGSAKVTVSGSPASASLSQTTASTSTLWAVTPGRGYNIRLWARSSITGTMRIAASWYGTDGTTFISSTASDIAITAANQWQLYEATFTSATDAGYMRPGPILIGSPPNGTLFWVDDIEVSDTSQNAWYSVYVTPGGTDQIRVGKIGPGVTRSWNQNLTANVVVDTWYRMKAQISGQRIRGKIWLDGTTEPKAWTVTYFDDQTVVEAGSVPQTGEVGFISKNGTALMTIDSVQIDQWRAHAEIAELPPRWDLSRSDRWVPIQARGILRRLGQGRKDLKSAMSLHLQSYSALSYGWWPLEDDTGDSASNNVERGPSGVIRGFSFSEPDKTGNAALPGVSGYAIMDTDTSSITVQVKPHTASGKETFLFFFRAPAVPATEQVVATFKTTGTARTWQISIQASGAERLVAKDKEGLTLVDQAFGMWGISDLPPGCWIAGTLYLLQNGGNVEFAFNHHRPGSTHFWSNNGVFAGSVGRFNEVSFKSSSAWTAAGNLQITQLMHYAGDLPFVDDTFHRAAVAYDGELATTRFLRLAANANINASLAGQQATSTLMGQQNPDKLVELLERSAEVEDSFMVEDRDDFALSLITRASMWNRVMVDLDIDAGHLSAPLDPNTDDQGTRNDVTAKRDNGGYARSIQLTGPLNVNPPEDDVDGVGTYDEGPSFNMYTDSQMQSVADWRRSKGTQYEPRYPAMHADLTATAYQSDAELVAKTMALDISGTIRLDNPEADYLLREETIASYTERADLYDWDLEFTANPGGVRRVGVVGYTTRVGSEGHVTSGSFVAGTGTKLTASLTGAGSAMTDLLTSEASFPFDIVVSGVQLRVTAKGDVLNTDPGFEAGIAAYAPSSANVTLAWDRQDFKRGAYSLRATSLAAGTDGAVVQAASAVTVVAAASYLVSGWIKTEIGATDVRLAVDWYQADNTTFISTGLPTLATTVANTWTWFSAVLVAPALSGRARLRLRNVYAGASKAWYDDVRIIPVTSYNTDPYTLTVQQVPINGIIKTIPSGSAIRLADPWHVGW